MNTAMMRGIYSRGAVVQSNDPENPETEILITCFVKEYINVEPGKRIELKGFEGEEIRKTVTITPNEGESLIIKEISSTIDDKIKYELQIKKEGGKYCLEVTNRSTDRDNFYGKILLNTNNQKKPVITLIVAGTLMKQFRIWPPSQTFSFGFIDTGRPWFQSMDLTKNAVLTDLRGTGLSIKDVRTSQDWIGAETKTIKKDIRYAIEISLKKDDLPIGDFDETVEVLTNYKKDYVIFRVKGTVR